MRDIKHVGGEQATRGLKTAEEFLNEDSFMTKDERKLSSMYTMFVYMK